MSGPGLPTLVLRGLSAPPTVRRVTLPGRLLWAALGWVAAAFVVAPPLILLTGRSVLTDLIPLAGLLLGALLVAPRRAPRTRLPACEVVLNLGHEGLRLLLRPEDHAALVDALRGWHQQGRDCLVSAQLPRRVSEFRVSDVRAHTVLSRD